MDLGAGLRSQLQFQLVVLPKSPELGAHRPFLEGCVKKATADDGKEGSKGGSGGMAQCYCHHSDHNTLDCTCSPHIPHTILQNCRKL